MPQICDSRAVSLDDNIYSTNTHNTIKYIQLQSMETCLTLANVCYGSPLQIRTCSRMPHTMTMILNSLPPSVLWTVERPFKIERLLAAAGY